MEEIAVAVTIVVLVFTFLFRVVTVNGISMLPNFTGGDRLLVTNIHGDLQQGDVVVAVNVLEEPIIKRVIATENQTVDIDFDTGTVYVDGQPLDETQFGLENGITVKVNTSEEMISFPQTVPPGCVFVLGDNRLVSEDSRYMAVGMISTDNILGKVFFRIYPFDQMGVIG
ncbi:MAG TPA: signal peptidase I [Firmicutes bacterium]|nr:signal peptidase I [Bacillota bacterium]